MSEDAHGAGDSRISKSLVITDTSVLMNFLVVDLQESLGRLKTMEFWITDHVRKEIKNEFPTQLERLRSCVLSKAFNEMSVTSIEELEIFGRFASIGLGNGECSAIAVASAQNWAIAIDDKVAIKRIRAESKTIKVFTTIDLVMAMIREEILSVEEADKIKEIWEREYRFKLQLHSFAEKAT